MLDRTELILSQRKIPALSNPARLSLSYLVPRRQSIKVTSLSLSLFPYPSLRYSLPLSRHLSGSCLFSPSVYLSLFLSSSILRFVAESVENDYPPWKIRRLAAASALGNRGYSSNRVARLAGSGASPLCAYTRGPSTPWQSGSATIDR